MKGRTANFGSDAAKGGEKPKHVGTAHSKPVASEDISNRVQARLCIVYTQVPPAKFDRARTSLMHDIFASTQFRHPPGLHATVTRPALSSAVVSRAS